MDMEYYSGLSFLIMIVAGFATVILFFGGLLFQMKKWGYGSEGYGKEGQGGSIGGFLKLLLSQIFDKKHEQGVLTTLVMDHALRLLDADICCGTPPQVWWHVW
jgi:heterodisulfide reductase subunit E